jgi:hypothetical protein
MKSVLVFCGFFVLALSAAPFDMAARAEWKSEPPEVMAGGEIIGQFYHLFSNVEPPHRVWVKYQDKIYLCRGESDNFQCQESRENGPSATGDGTGAATAATADGAPAP